MKKIFTVISLLIISFSFLCTQTKDNNYPQTAKISSSIVLELILYFLIKKEQMLKD